MWELSPPHRSPLWTPPGRGAGRDHGTNPEHSPLATAHPVWSPDAPSPASGPRVLGLSLYVSTGRPVVGKAGAGAGGCLPGAGAVVWGWPAQGPWRGGGALSTHGLSRVGWWATLRLSSAETQPGQASVGLRVGTEKPREAVWTPFGRARYCQHFTFSAPLGEPGVGWPPTSRGGSGGPVVQPRAWGVEATNRGPSSGQACGVGGLLGLQAVRLCACPRVQTPASRLGAGQPGFQRLKHVLEGLRPGG